MRHAKQSDRQCYTQNRVIGNATHSTEGPQHMPCDRWCAPYAYKMRPEVGCGGADKWTVVPNGAFPGYWWAYGQGNLFCEAGHYCPNTTVQVCPCFCSIVKLSYDKLRSVKWLYDV